MGAGGRQVLLVDGRLERDLRVRLAADDPGLLAGVTAFETVRVHAGRGLDLAAHLDRLRRSAALLGISCPPGPALLAWCWTAMAALGHDEAVLRITLTAAGAAFVLARPAPRRRTAARCATGPWLDDPYAVPAAKHGNRLRGQRALQATGADEVLWTRPGGLVVEGTWSNAFAVVDGVLRTHPDDGRLLAGITRAALLRAADQRGLPVELRAFSLDEPLDELFLSSSVSGLVPVIELDGQPAPGAGPVAAALGPLLWERSAG